MITTAEEILFRCSGLGHILTNPKGKTAKEKFDEAKKSLDSLTSQYGALVNKSTKTAASIHKKILDLNTKLLTLEKKAQEIELSETCRKALLKIYAEQVKGRREELKNKFLDKGNVRENVAITLVSRVLKKFYKKNEERRSNGFISGEWDLHDEVDGKIIETLDTKCSWSYITFLEAQEKELNSIYESQGDGYMWLTGAEKHTVIYCLVNGTYQYIKDQIRALSWRHGVLDADITDNENFIEDVKQLERNHIFDINEFLTENPDYQPKNDVWLDGDAWKWSFDIPKEERVYKITFNRDEKRIEKIKERVTLCRKYMNNKYFKL